MHEDLMAGFSQSACGGCFVDGLGRLSHHWMSTVTRTDTLSFFKPNGENSGHVGS